MGLLDCLITWMAGKNLVRSAAFGISASAWLS